LTEIVRILLPGSITIDLLMVAKFFRIDCVFLEILTVLIEDRIQ
jgi:hypothetical protein